MHKIRSLETETRNAWRAPENPIGRYVPAQLSTVDTVRGLKSRDRNNVILVPKPFIQQLIGKFGGRHAPFRAVKEMIDNYRCFRLGRHSKKVKKSACYRRPWMLPQGKNLNLRFEARSTKRLIHFM